MAHLVKIIVFLIVTGCFGQLEIQTEELVVYNDSVQLPGTLSYAESKKKSPLVIFVHGSGPNDRDGNTAASPVKLNYIKDFTHSLNQEGLAVFRFDKRTASSENRRFTKNTKVIDLASDIDKIILHFEKDKRFKDIIIIGHSQGSLLGMLLEKNPSKFISIAGAGETIDKTLIRQIGEQSELFGELTKQYIEELKQKGRTSNVNPMLRTVFNDRSDPFLLDWLQYDPTIEIKKVTAPTLIVQGEMDSQVRVEDAENLYKAKSDAVLKIIPKLNHLLREVSSPAENQQSYMGGEFPISEELVAVIIEFIKS